MFLVRFEKLVPGVSVEMKPRHIPPRLIREHGALCSAFGLDPVRTRIDVPSTWGEDPRAGRLQQALVFWHDTATDVRPIGKMTIMHEAEKIRDDNPTNARDFFNLSNRM